MAEAEEERRKMGNTIDRLERDKKELQISNARTIEENKYLLDQLEQLNNSVSDSDAQILMLNATLDSTREEMNKLAILAAQTSQLEAQVCAMEDEHERLLLEMELKDDRSQTAVQRYNSAERTISVLSQQVDWIEKEAREERARHVEIVARLERRRAVERELETAAGRLKGAAAATTIGSQNGSSSVVSNFVKDVLQDNANLQMGIVELREMLVESNEEVENLREQMMLHQPVPAGTEIDNKPFLDAELMKTPTADKPDLHVHHHYHAAPKSNSQKSKAPGLRRPKKKRYPTSPGFQTPNAGTQTPGLSCSPQTRATSVSSAATILSQTSATVPPHFHDSACHAHKWSTQSSQGLLSAVQSSVPSSPQSMYQDQLVFDTADDLFNSSRPTSPASTNLGSPDFQPRHSKRGSDVSIRNLTAPPVSLATQSISGVLRDDSFGEPIAFPMLDHSTIPEESEDEASRPSTVKSVQQASCGQDDQFFSQVRTRLHRASSAESILSSRGIEIPNLRSKGSQLLSSPRTSLGTSTTSIQPIMSVTSAVGKPSTVSRHYDSSSYNRLLLASTSPTSPTSVGRPVTLETSRFGRKLGGWMTGKWGVTPTVSSGELRAKASLATVDTKPAAAKGKSAAGIKKNANRLSTHVEAVTINNTLLEEALEGV